MSSLHTSDPNPTKPAQSGKERRGPKGYFMGSRKAFLESQLPDYMATKKGSRQTFWHRLYCAWWLRYPWKLDDNEEPPMDIPARMTRLGAIGPGEAPLKQEVESKLKVRLSQWFSNRASATANSGLQRDTLAWLPLLQQLHQLRNPRPRRRTATQQFMLDYAGVVDASFLHRHGDGATLSRTQKMNMRYDVAKSLLANQYSHLINGLNKKAGERFDADTNEWNLILDDVSCAKDITQARDTLFDAVHPLLQAIGTYAGCYVSLVAGNTAADEAGGEFFTAVHWSPGDRKASKDWTQWNEDGFNSGVAGPFLAYAGETNQMLKVEDNDPTPVIQTPQASPSPVLPSTTSINSDEQLADTPPPAHMESPIPTAAPRANFRPPPTRRKLPPTLGTNKRKLGLKSTPIHYFEDSPNNSDEAGNYSGDGSSSGDSVFSNAPPRAKRPRISAIVTRSSKRSSAPNVGIRDTLSSSSPTLAVAGPAPAITGADTSMPADYADNPLIDTAGTTTFPHLTNLQPPGTPADTVDVIGSPSGAAPRTTSHASGIPPVETEHIHPSEIDVTPAAVTEPINATETETTPIAEPELVRLAPIAGASSVVTPATTPPALSNEIDAGNIPTFLRVHGTGSRKVDIFAYLNEVQDPHFREVLFHYIDFELNDKSGTNGSLPTAKRPAEISQWTSKARPASIPDYTKGKRTFQAFVDSILAWWGSLQPSWRSFKRGAVSRGVQGDWAALHAPRINGLLNVVILVYWWARILEQDPVGGVRADYEYFADDVAWVFSQLST